METNSSTELMEFEIFDNDLPFLKTWKDSWKIFDRFFIEKNLQSLREKYYDTSFEIIKILFEIGHVKLDLIINIAQLYTFCVLTKLNTNIFTDYFDEIIIDATNILIKNSTSPEFIFSNPKYPYLEKIKFAEYIFELNNVPTFEKLNEIKNMILFNENTFKNSSLYIELKRNFNKM